MLHNFRNKRRLVMHVEKLFSLVLFIVRKAISKCCESVVWPQWSADPVMKMILLVSRLDLLNLHDLQDLFHMF